MSAPPGAIDRSLGVPLYHQLEDVLRRDIDTGHYAVGEMLPSESEICARYELSRSVVRQTLHNLAQAGIIRTERGRGSFVAETKLSERFVQRTTGFYDDLKSMGLHVDTRTLRQEIATVPPQARVFLGSDTAVRLDRLRSVEGRVLALVRTYVSAERCPGLERFDLSNRSLYAHLRDVYGLEVHSGYRTVEAVAADEEVAAFLDIEPGTPVLLLCSASSTADGRPLEWFYAWHRADRTRFEVEIAPGSDRRPFEQALRADVSQLTQVGGSPPPDGPGPGTAAAVTPAPDPVRPGGVDDVDGGRFAAVLARERVVAVVRGPRFADGGRIAAALAAGGVHLLEFDVGAANAFDAISRAREGAPESVVGAGSVVTLDQARRAVDAGAQFLVSSVTVAEIATAGLGVPVIFAGYTPSEILTAHRLTGGHVRLFPASVGGVAYLKALTESFPDIPLVPAGGVTARTVADFLAAGAAGVSVGTALCPLPAVVGGDGAELTRRAAVLRAAIDRAAP